jgi:hypothetical protein
MKYKLTLVETYVEGVHIEEMVDDGKAAGYVIVSKKGALLIDNGQDFSNEAEEGEVEVWFKGTKEYMSFENFVTLLDSSVELPDDALIDLSGQHDYLITKVEKA